MSLFNSVLALVTRKRSSSASTAAACYVCGGDVRHLCVRCRHRAR